MYSQPEGQGQPKKRPRKAGPLSGNVDTIRASGTLGEAFHCVQCACRCPADLVTGRFCAPHLILNVVLLHSLQGSLIGMLLATSPSRKHVNLTIQCTSKPSYANQHKLAAGFWGLQCKCVGSEVACVQSVVRSVITVAAM